jgi:hypothetical protein
MLIICPAAIYRYLYFYLRHDFISLTYVLRWATSGRFVYYSTFVS